jgi:hypothetical protein
MYLIEALDPGYQLIVLPSPNLPTTSIQTYVDRDIGAPKNQPESAHDHEASMVFWSQQDGMIHSFPNATVF